MLPPTLLALNLHKPSCTIFFSIDLLYDYYNLSYPVFLNMRPGYADVHYIRTHMKSEIKALEKEQTKTEQETKTPPA